MYWWKKRNYCSQTKLAPIEKQQPILYKLWLIHINTNDRTTCSSFPCKGVDIFRDEIPVYITTTSLNKQRRIVINNNDKTPCSRFSHKEVGIFRSEIFVYIPGYLDFRVCCFFIWTHFGEFSCLIFDLLEWFWIFIVMFSDLPFCSNSVRKREWGTNASFNLCVRVNKACLYDVCIFVRIFIANCSFSGSSQG